LRVLHVTPYYEPAYVYGGPVRSVAALCRALRVAGAEIAVYTTTANGKSDVEVPAKVIANGIEIHYFPRSMPRSRFTAPGLSRAVSERVCEFDIVHVTGLWTKPVAVAALAARKAKVPYVVSPRGMLMSWELSHKAWKKQPYLYLRELPRLRRSAAIHCTSPQEKRALSRFGLDGSGFVVPNIVDAAEFDTMPERMESRKRLRVPENVPVLLLLGRLHGKKGIEDTLESFRRLVALGSSAHLMVVGPDEGNYRDRIADWQSKCGLSNRVHVTGALTGPERLAAFAASDVFISLSESENFSMATAEAMAAGLPVVVSPGVGLGPWIEEAGAGVVIERDPDAVVAVLQDILSHPDHRATFGARGRAMVRRTFSAAAVGSAMLAAYQGIVYDYRSRPTARTASN